MFKTWRSMAGVVGIVAVIFGLPFVTPWFNAEQRTKIFLVELVALVEFLAFFVSRYIWKTVRTAFESGHRMRLKTTVTVNNNAPLKLTRCFLLIVLALAHYSLASRLFYFGEDPYLINFASFVCSGLVVLFFIFHVCISLFVRLNLWLWKNHVDFIRKVDRVRVHQATVSVCAFLAIVMSLFGIYRASLPPVVSNIDIPITGLPRSMNGFSIVLISDIHLGPTVSREKLARVVHIVNDLKPDVVALVGDFSDGSVEQLKSSAEPVRDIKAKYGKFFVTGNHEYYTGDVENWFLHLRNELGFMTLHNTHVNITNRAGDYFCLAGTDDIEGHRMQQAGHGMNLDKAVQSCDPKRPIILLAHQPRAAKIALDSDYNIQLVLSGHTHGGQMFPMVIIAYFANPFYSGLYRYRSGYVYVTQGAVYWGIPMRHFSFAEVARIFLHSSEGVELH